MSAADDVRQTPRARAQVTHEAFEVSLTEVLLTMASSEPGEVAGEARKEWEQPGGDRVSEQSPPTKLN
jgi:hypothetical protein